MRRAAAIAVAALALAGCGGGAEELLPDLVQAEPRAVGVFREGGRDLLTFISAVDNEGAGPLVLESRRPSVDELTMSVRQLVRRTDGSEAAHAVTGEVRYVDSETHRHWHVLRFERYELRAMDGRLVAPDRKTGFCLGDRYDAHRNATIPGEPEDAVWIGECGRGEPERLVLRQGLSPGFGDDYVPRLEGQYVDVTDVPEGRYRLVHRVNVDRAMRESDYTNNVASVVVVLERSDGTVHVRTVY